MELYEITEEAIMAKNPVQFQKGLGLHEFLEDYGSEEQCRGALYRLRWPAAMRVRTAGIPLAVRLKSARYINVISAIIRLRSRRAPSSTVPSCR
jgi:hypothetical protein